MKDEFLHTFVGMVMIFGAVVLAVALTVWNPWIGVPVLTVLVAAIGAGLRTYGW